MGIMIRKLDNGMVLVRNLATGESKVLKMTSAMDYVQKLLESKSEGDNEI